MKDLSNITKDILYDVYITKRIDVQLITSSLDINVSQLYYLLNKYNISKRIVVPTEERICEICKTTFTCKMYEKKRFCSNKCSGINKSNTHPRYVKVKCNYCNNEIQRTNYYANKNKYFFCNKDCESRYRSEYMCGVNNPTYKRIETICDYCNKPILVQPCRYYRSEKSYCSIKCKKLGSKGRFAGKESPHWKGENYKKYRYGHIWLSVRRKIRRRDNYTCQLCHISEQELDQELTIHHIKSVRNFDTIFKAHSSTNLISVCKNCHNFIHSKYNVDEIYIEK